LIWKNVESEDDWDFELAESVRGALVVVSVDYCEPDGTRIERDQFWGHIMEADRLTGIRLRLGGDRSGEVVNLPPDLSWLKKAKPGVYGSNKGEKVVDPDFTASYQSTKPKS
jgi:hypothetical protein